MFLISSSLNVGKHIPNTQYSLFTKDLILELRDKDVKVYDISAGGGCSVIHVATNFGVFSRGSNESEGQLGLDSEDSATFIRNAKLDGANITSISSGSIHTLFLGNGQPWSTGYNQHGECAQDIESNTGNGHRTPKKISLHLFGNARILQVSAGEFGYHSLFLTERNELFVCGYGGFSTLGQGNSLIQPVPVRVLHGDWLHDRIVKISAGQWHSCVITNQKTCYAWGYNAQGQLANGAPSLNNHGYFPERVQENITNVSCGISATALVDDRNKVSLTKTPNVVFEGKVTGIWCSSGAVLIDDKASVYFSQEASGSFVKCIEGDLVTALIGRTPSVTCSGSYVIVFNKDIPNESDAIFRKNLMKIVSNNLLVDSSILTLH